jgi:hypothetical protein
MAKFRQETDTPMTDAFRCAGRALIALLVALEFAVPAAAAEARIWGRVVDGKGAAVVGPVVVLIDQDERRAPIEAVGDEDGVFRFLALPPGRYTIRAERDKIGRCVKTDIAVAATSDIQLVLTLAPVSLDPGQSSVQAADAASLGGQTTITAPQIAALPTGNSIGSILENLDFSATTNRIDVGGLWQTRPVLFGARGGVSWQQNVYLLNGMDIGDPFWTGQPMWQPDVFSLRSIGSITAAFPAWAFSPGGQLSLTPKFGTEEFHGGVWGFYADKNWSANNITSALRKENLTESDTVNRMMDANLHLSGPLGGGGATFFTSWSAQSVGRKLTGFESEDRSALISGLFHVEIPYARDVLRVLWAGQSAIDDSAGAERDVEWAATTRRKMLSNILQVIYESKPGRPNYRRFGLSWSSGFESNAPQLGVDASPRLDLFQTARASAPAQLDGAAKHKLVLTFDGSSLWTGLGPSDHRLEYGVQARYSTGRFTREIPGNVQLLYEGTKAAEAAVFNGPFRYQASAFDANAYLQDTITLFDFLTVRAGLNAAYTVGWNGTSRIRWLTLSPRAEVTIPLSAGRTSALKIEGGRYDLQLPLNYLMWGNPKAPGAAIYSWSDPNGNGRLDEGELGPLLRKDGPAFSTIDSAIRRPYLNEFMLSYIQGLGHGWRLTLSGFLRETRDLIAVSNIGVTAADYTAQTYNDIGDDRLFGDQDDLTFTVWNRNRDALGRDAFLLTNVDAQNRASTYKGLDLTVTKSWNEQFYFSIALTAMEIIGTTNPGNTEWENDDGVLGALYTDPNNAINARGRMRFDRAYTARIGGSLALPLGTRLGLVAKYYDGQPFTRLIVLDGLNQGPLFIQAHARGVARYEYNMTVDARLEKSVRLGSTVLRLMVDVFNAFNQNLATEESALTNSEFPLRFATRIQSPRFFRAGFNFEF